MALKSELEGPPFPDSLPDLVVRFNDCIHQYPENIALICTHQSSDLYGVGSVALDTHEYRSQPYLRWTYTSLDRNIDRLAAALESRTIARNTPFFIFSGNTAEYVLATWAAHRLGHIHVPINPRNLSNTEEVKYMIRTILESQKSEQMVVIAGSKDMIPQIDDLTCEWDCLKICVAGASEQWLPFEQLMENSEGQPKQSQMLRSLYTTVLFTSGTTSRPKGCAILGSTYIATLELRHELGAPLAGDRVAVVVPNNHALNYIHLMTTLTHGATLVFPGPSFTPEETWVTIQRERCTHAAMVSTMVDALSTLKAHKDTNLQCLKGVILADMPVTPAIVRKCQQDLGAVTVENMYVATEGVQVFTGHVENLEDTGRKSYVAAGMPAGGSSIRICAHGGNKTLPRGVPGELHFSGPQMIDSYMGVRTDDFYNGEDGRRWFITGDQAVVGHDARLYVIGRYKDIIIRGGKNISSVAIEEVLAQTHEFRRLEVLVIGIPDSIAGEVPIAIVNQSIDLGLANSLKSTIRSKMGLMYVPIDIVSLKDLGPQQFPRTFSGKVQKAKLRAFASQFLGDRNVDSANEQESASVKKAHGSQRLGPPTAEDMSLIFGKLCQFYPVKDAIQKIIAPYHLCWDDVADVMPMSDFVHMISKAHIMGTWNLRHLIVSNNATSEQLRLAVERTMASHPLMLSFLALDQVALGPDIGLYVTIRQTRKILDQCILDHGTVSRIEDVRILFIDPYKSHTVLPGPLFHGIIVFVEEIKSAVLIWSISYAIIDVTYANMFIEDLNSVLSGIPLSRVPFKVWADSYHSLRRSQAAKAAVTHQANCLQLFNEKEYTWWPYSAPTSRATAHFQLFSQRFFMFSAPGIISLCQQHPEITASTVIKAACALLIMYHNKHSQALFANLERQRAFFPFLHSSLSALGGFEAADVAGPTSFGVINFIALHPDETTVQFLRRVKNEQTLLTRYAGVPWHEVVGRLGPSAEELLLKAVDTFIFNWIPGLGAKIRKYKTSYSNFKIQTYCRTSIGILLNVGMGGDHGSQVILFYEGRSSRFSDCRITEDLKKIVRWLVEKESWELPIEEFRACLETGN